MLKNISLVIIFTLSSFSSLAARDVSQIHLKPGDDNWSLGMGIRGGTFPYDSSVKIDDLFPLIVYNGAHFFIDGTRAGFHLYDDKQWLVSAYGAYRFGGYNDDDSDYLEGMERFDGFDARLALTLKTTFGSITLDLGHDVAGSSNGFDTELRWGKVFEQGDYFFRPWISLNYENQKLVNYYYGVMDTEATVDRSAYETDDAFEIRYGVDMSYRMGQHHYVGLNIQYSDFAITKVDSPIVVDNGKFSSFASYRYEFNDFTGDPNHNGRLVSDLTKGQWYWRVAAGRHTDENFNKLMRFQDMFKPEERGTGLASLFVGKKIADRFLWLPLEAYVTTGIARRFEKGLQDNFNEYVLGFKVYFYKFPWSKYVNTRLGIAEGVSYAAKVPFVEKEHVEGKNRSASKFLNYLDWSWDVSIGDIIKQPKLKECYLGWSIHHRSGIFASSDFFGNVNGGSNVNTLYLQCHNNG